MTALASVYILISRLRHCRELTSAAHGSISHSWASPADPVSDSTNVYTSTMVAPLTEQTRSYEVKRVRADLDLSREKLARVFDVSAKTIERWEAKGSLPKDAAGRRLLAELREIVDLATIVFGTDGMRRFLALPLPGYDGATPLQLIERRQSGAVLALLATDYDGIGP